MGINSNEELPEISALLSSLVRILANYIYEPSASQLMVSLKIIEHIEQHPEASTVPTAKVAINQAREILNYELKKPGINCAFMNNKNVPDGTTSH